MNKPNPQAMLAELRQHLGTHTKQAGRAKDRLADLAELLRHPRESKFLRSDIEGQVDGFLREVRREQRLFNGFLLHVLAPWLPVTAQQVADAMGVSPVAVSRMKRRQELPPHVRIGRTDYWSALDVLDLLMDTWVDQTTAGLEKIVMHPPLTLAQAHAMALELLLEPDTEAQDPMDVGADEHLQDNGQDYLS